MNASPALEAAMAAIETATRVDICRGEPGTLEDVGRLSLGHGGCGGWSRPEPGLLATGDLEVSATGDGTPTRWAVSNADCLLQTGPIPNPERVLPGMLVRMPGLRIELMQTT